MFTYELANTLNPLSNQDWDALFAGHPDRAQLITLMNESGLEGFQFYSIICRLNGEPVVLLPLFETSYAISSSLEGMAKNVVINLEKLLPFIFKPRVLGIGFVEGEWGQLGINEKHSAETIESAVQGCIEFLENVAKSHDVQIVAFKDFTATTMQRLPDALLKQYIQADSLPFCQINMQFKTIEEYLNSLPRKVRQDLRRKMRQSTNVKVIHEKRVEPFIDRIYALYVEHVKRSDLSFGTHNKRYFSEICAAVPGAQYILFFMDDELIGFNLIIHANGCLVDKYISMDNAKGRAQNIYFIAWLEKINYCIDHHIPLLHLGAAAEDIKARMGAYMTPTFILFRHRNPLAHFVMSKFASVLSYKPSVSGPATDIKLC